MDLWGWVSCLAARLRCLVSIQRDLEETSVTRESLSCLAAWCAIPGGNLRDARIRKPSRRDARASANSFQGGFCSLDSVTWDECAQLAGSNEKIEKEVHEPNQPSLLVPESDSIASKRVCKSPNSNK